MKNIMVCMLLACSVILGGCMQILLPKEKPVPAKKNPRPVEPPADPVFSDKEETLKMAYTIARNEYLRPKSLVEYLSRNKKNRVNIQHIVEDVLDADGIIAAKATSALASFYLQESRLDLAYRYAKESVSLVPYNESYRELLRSVESAIEKKK